MARRTRHTVAICTVLAVAAAVAADIPRDQRRSGADFMSAETRAMQDDDTGNPGMLWVLEGEQAWDTPQGAGDVACSGCHGDAADSMRGVAARHPAFDEALERPVDLATRINRCRSTHQQLEPLAHESRELLALTAYVAHQSRGLPAAPPPDPRLAPFRAHGRQLFERRIGQLDLACSACHDDHWGERLGGNPIPQAHPTGYPLYRLEWQSLGSLQRRLRNCMIGVRAEPYPFGAPEMIDLELYLMQRAEGLPIETPAVRP
ncbi:sulfur oxidation c-type cytochrome SoxA [Luteimonas suaedae]|uniref:sulfur oxidation c-type cytochrome SoxA n=1 Tax=Luteimonas suaedae TaxID=2605430 RepID=UPI0011ECC3B2|nr:sulfur oxidation c-type cytochrome SoxA [Luteimonas suaedae]